MQVRSSLLIVLLGALTLASQGCATKRQTGAVTGGAVGAAAGAAINDEEGALIGGLLGALVGSEVGSHMDQQDRYRTAAALEDNQVGETSAWTDPDTGERYSVTPTDTYSRSGSPCRQFVIEREIGGEQFQSTETACRQADGTWHIIS